MGLRGHCFEHTATDEKRTQAYRGLLKLAQASAQRAVALFWEILVFCKRRNFAEKVGLRGLRLCQKVILDRIPDHFCTIKKAQILKNRIVNRCFCGLSGLRPLPQSHEELFTFFNDQLRRVLQVTGTGLRGRRGLHPTAADFRLFKPSKRRRTI